MAKKEILDDKTIEINNNNFNDYDFYLTVKSDFLEYKKGDRITENEKISDVINKDYLIRCVKTKRN